MGTDGVDVRLVVPTPTPGATPGTPATTTSDPTLFGGRLPRTGADVVLLLLVAVLVLAAGALLVRAGRLVHR